jgi:Tfp pilus assembly protein PilV
LLTERIRGEFGYSLVEVMVSILIISLAILPMVGMFDMGLQTVTRGSNYDKSRALANLKMEEAKSLPFADLESNFPEAATPYSGSGNYLSDWMTDSGESYWDDNYANFEYRIEKQYMTQPPTDSDGDPALPSQDWDTSGTPTDLIRVTVTVRWADGNEFTTFGLVSA